MGKQESKLGLEANYVKDTRNLSDKLVKILVVDDERDMVDILKMSLESDNYNVVGAYTGYQAIEKTHSEIPDLILLDIMLPDMTGYEVCNELKKDPSTRLIPIIMLTGLGEAGRIAGQDLGADAYITKPFDLNELKAKIRAFSMLENTTIDENEN